MCLCPNKGCNKAIDLRASRSPTVRERGTSDHGAAGPTKGKEACLGRALWGDATSDPETSLRFGRAGFREVSLLAR